MKEVLDFLSRLSSNNNKQWFDEHKGEYLAVKSKTDELAMRIVSGIGDFDESVRNLQLKDCTYRIYRDIRFSADKSPYKTHIGVFIVKGGKKSGNAGYYMHIQPSESFLWAGLHMPLPNVLRSVREEIMLDGNLFEQAIDKATGFSLDKSCSLKRVPYEYPSDSQYSELLKLKDLGVIKYIDEKFIYDRMFAENVVDSFSKTYEFVQLLNRSVDYAREMF